MSTLRFRPEPQGSSEYPNSVTAEQIVDLAGGGFTGAQGYQGASGSQGNQGSGGSQGNQGSQGSQGHQGTTGTGAQGAQGFQGNPGSLGNQGSTGSQGSQGHQGSAGVVTGDDFRVQYKSGTVLAGSGAAYTDSTGFSVFQNAMPGLVPNPHTPATGSTSTADLGAIENMRQRMVFLEYMLVQHGFMEADTSERNLGYFALVGSPPLARKEAWFTWHYTLLYKRLNNVPLHRGTTYHFAQNGNDTTGNGSITNPYKTLAKAQTLSAGAHDRRFRFRRGDVWREDGVTFAIEHHCTIDAYGTGDKPKWTEFVYDLTPGDLGGEWTVHSGNAYVVSEVRDIAWVKYRDAPKDIGQPLEKVSSSANCVATPFSFYLSGTQLFVNLDGEDPNDEALEGCPGTANNSTFQLSGDNCRMQDIRIEGYGMHDNASAGVQTYSLIMGVSTGTDEQVVEGCEIYFGGYHSIGALGPGKSVMKDCTVGLGRVGPGITMLVSFSSNGGQETIFDNITLHSGNLHDVGLSRGSAQCIAIYAHTGTGVCDLIIARGITHIPGPHSSVATAGFTGLPSATVLEDVRCFLVQEYADEGGDRPLIVSAAPPSTAQMNCFYRSVTTGPGTGNNAGPGFAYNCTWSRNNPVGYGSTFVDVANGGMFVNCCFHATHFGAIFKNTANAVNWANLKIYNSLVICDNFATALDQTVLNMSNSAGNIDYNAYYMVDPVVGNNFNLPAGSAGDGAIGDAHKVMLAGPVALLYQPVSSDNFYDDGDAAVQPDYDYYRTFRGTRKTIGPVHGVDD